MAVPTVLARIPGELAFYAKDAAEPSSTLAASSFITSSDGSALSCVTPETVDVYETVGQRKIASIPEPDVVFSALSPKCGYVITVTKPRKDENGQPGKNLKVWELSSGTCVLQVSHKQVNRDSWPALHWGGDDSCVLHCVTNTVHVYRQTDNFASFSRVTVLGITSLAMIPL
eukprot:gene1420-32791_t